MLAGWASVTSDATKLGTTSQRETCGVAGLGKESLWPPLRDSASAPPSSRAEGAEHILAGGGGQGGAVPGLVGNGDQYELSTTFLCVRKPLGPRTTPETLA